MFKMFSSALKSMVAIKVNKNFMLTSLILQNFQYSRSYSKFNKYAF